MIVIIKTSLGIFMGGVKDNCMVENFEFELCYPCMIDFIPVPVQGRLGGQPGIGYIRSVSAWPERTLIIHGVTQYAYSIIDDPESDFRNLYQKTVDEAWPKKTIY